MSEKKLPAEAAPKEVVPQIKGRMSKAAWDATEAAGPPPHCMRPRVFMMAPMR
ncbi:MAG: hypothetical protein K0Q55_2408 [Verrucomicrobia bacterium]|nr:hypothetical protein [Verrucomicrobiota bacterium]